jgi:hypothetical protein
MWIVITMKIPYKYSLAGAVLALAVSGSSQAFQPNWDTVSFKYIEEGDSDITFKGFELEISKLVTKKIYLLGEYEKFSEIYEQVDIDAIALTAGIGYRHSLSYTTDVYVEAGYESLEINATYNGNEESVKDEGYSAKVGVLARWFVETEIDIYVKQFEWDVGTTLLGANVNYYISRQWAVRASYIKSDDAAQWGVGVLFAF